MRRSIHEAQQAREIRDASAEVRLAILHRIGRLVGSANPVAVEHLANAYTLVAGTDASSPPRVVDLRSIAPELTGRET
ncbi:MAG TPA: hypothetical protein VLA82_12930 [Actinomycetota bacterium]|nr:hypothetical protein [Actinomycetota bacterium]